MYLPTLLQQLNFNIAFNNGFTLLTCICMVVCIGIIVLISITLPCTIILSVAFLQQWGSKKSLLAVNSGGTVQILTEHIMNTHFNQQVNMSAL